MENEKMLLNNIRPPVKCLNIDVTKMSPQFDTADSYGSELPQGHRHFFYLENDYQDNESELLQYISYHLAVMDYNQPKWWKEGDTLRIQYSCKLNPDNSIEGIKQYINWVNFNYGKPLSANAKSLLYDRSISIISRTKNEYKPIIYIDFRDLETLEKMEDTANTFIYLMFLVREYMCIPGVIEHSVIIMNMREKNSFAIGRTFKLILDIINNSFYAMVDQIYLYKISSSMKYFYKSVQSSLSPFVKENILTISDTDYDQIDFENPEQFLENELLSINLEQTIDWIPKQNDKILLDNVIDNNMLRMNRIEPFQFSDKAYDEFHKGSNEFDLKDQDRQMKNNVKQDPNRKSILKQDVGTHSERLDADFQRDRNSSLTQDNNSYFGYFVGMMKSVGFNCCTQR